jgi:protein required for attachment to host cells
MPEHATKNQKNPLTWVLVADGQQARFYGYHQTTQRVPLTGANPHHYFDEKSGFELAPIADETLNAQTLAEYQIGHDRRGTSSSSSGTGHNTFEPHGDIEAELKRRFSKIIADRLEHACRAKLFDRLILAAPAKMIGELRKELPADVAARITAVLSKDLMHFHGRELFQHLQEALEKDQVA